MRRHVLGLHDPLGECSNANSWAPRGERGRGLATVVLTGTEVLSPGAAWNFYFCLVTTGVVLRKLARGLLRPTIGVVSPPANKLVTHPAKMRILRFVVGIA